MPTATTSGNGEIICYRDDDTERALDAIAVGDAGGAAFYAGVAS